MTDYTGAGVGKSLDRADGESQQEMLDDIQLEAQRYVKNLEEEFDQLFYGDREIPQVGPEFEPKKHIPALRQVINQLLTPQQGQEVEQPNRFGGSDVGQSE